MSDVTICARHCILAPSTPEDTEVCTMAFAEDSEGNSFIPHARK